MSRFCVILSTVSTLKEARKLAEILLEKRLAACINITSAAESHYRWEGKKRRGREHLLVIKARSSRFKEVSALIHKHHSYQVPEVIQLPLQNISPKYMRWLDQETASTEK